MAVQSAQTWTRGATVAPGVVLLGLLLGFPASAQDDDGGSTATPDDAGASAAPIGPDLLPPAPEPPPVRWADDHRWVELGFDRPAASVVLTRAGRLLSMDTDGAIYRSEDGFSWRVVLATRPGDEVEIDEEALLLDAESAIDDLVEIEETDDDGYVPDGETLDVDADVADLADEVADVGSDIAVLDAQDRVQAAAAKAAGRLWVDPLRAGRILAGRPDGLWQSLDMGRSWQRIEGPASARAFLRTPGGALYVGGADGLWAAEGGSPDSLRKRSLGPSQVHTIAVVGGLMFVGNDDGLLVSFERERFAPFGDLDGVPVYDIEPDPDFDGGMWLVTRRGILRSDDLGQSHDPVGRNPLVGTTELRSLGRPGALLAVGALGVWESIDGGVTWAPLAEQLPSPDALDLFVDERGVLVAGKFGLYRLARGAAEAPEAPESLGVRIVLPPLSEVVTRALHRPGLDISDLSVGRKVVLARLTPVLDLQVNYADKLNRRTDYLDQFTTEVEDHNWTGSVKLCWGRCGSTTEVLYDVEVDASDLSSLGVVGGEVYDFSTDDAVPAAAANAAAKAVSYRTSVADIVSRAWFARHALGVEAEGLDTMTLAQRIDHTLRVAEADARLDLYTDGWFTRALAADLETAGRSAD